VAEQSWIALSFLILENVRKYSCVPTVQNIDNNKIRIIINYISCVLYGANKYLAKDYKGNNMKFGIISNIVFSHII
jgi:hypothetical protein